MTWRNGRVIERLATLPRQRRGEELRISVNEVINDEGHPPSGYVSLRIYFNDRATGTMRASSRGVTFRRRELATVMDALARADVMLGGGR